MIRFLVPDGEEVVVENGYVPRAGEWVMIGSVNRRYKAEAPTYTLRVIGDDAATMDANVGLQVP